MGQSFSKNVHNFNPVNYNCPVCRETKKAPNLAGRFFLIDDKNCKCNGCNTILPKSQMYKN
jgi:hypothetical protein